MKCIKHESHAAAVIWRKKGGITSMVGEEAEELVLWFTEVTMG